MMAIEDYKCPVCPICGEECDTLYLDRNREIFGCDVCVAAEDAWEFEEDHRHE